MAAIFTMHSDWMFIFVAFAWVSIHQVNGATQAVESGTQAVKIKLYGLSTSKFSAKKTTFHTVIASEATTYCTNSPSACGLDSAAIFAQSDVGSSSGEKDGSSVEFTFYVNFPAGASVTAGGATDNVVPKAAARAIAAAARDEVKDEVGYYITYIDEEYYSIPPDGDTNKVVVPIAFVVVFVLAITAVALHYYHKNKERREQIAQRLNRKKQQQHQHGASPSYSALDTTNTTILTANNSNTTPRRGFVSNNNNNFSPGMTNSHSNKFSTRDKFSHEDSKQVDEGPVVVSLAKFKQNQNQQHQQSLSPRRSKPASANGLDKPSVNDFHDGNVVLGYGDKTNNSALEPLSVMENLEEDDTRREKKRRRKEKRREKKRRELGGDNEAVMETSYENPVFNSSNLSDGSFQYQHPASNSFSQ